MELIKVEDKTLVEYFTNGGMEPVLKDIEKLAMDFEPDISSVKGRAAITAQASRVQKSRKHLEDLRKNIVDDWTKKTKAINSEGRVSRDFLLALQDKVRKPLTDWENKEKDRVEKYKEMIKGIMSYSNLGYGYNSKEIELAIKELSELSPGNDAGEFKEQIEGLKKETLEKLKLILQEKIKQEKKDAELEELRKKEEERKQVERDNQIKKEAADKATREAENKAKVEREKVESEKQEAIEREEKAKREKTEAEQRAKDAEEKAAKDAKDAELRVAEDKKEAEEKRLRDIEEAKRQERIIFNQEKANKESEEKERQEDVEHRRKINNEICEALVNHPDLEVQLTDAMAKKIIRAVVNLEIPHVRIRY